MKIMLCVLGEGRGHMTQAMAVKELAEAAGHQIVSVMLGAGRQRQVPAYFASAMRVPVTPVPTLEFVYKNNREVDMFATAIGVLRRLPEYVRGLRKIDAVVRDTQPDVILNFFEPVAGLYTVMRRRRPPVVALGHQFMFLHPDYLRPPHLKWHQLGLKLYTRFIGLRATKLALSLYPVADLPAKNLFVGPPLLRGRLFGLTPNPHGDFVLVYLLNHGYARQIIEWSDAHPATRLHCFYDKPDAPPEQAHSPALTFHRLDGEKFLRMMADCRHVVCTAGFESVSEAAWLGKPLFLVPVENHSEQQINALDAVQAGLGLTDKSFNLDRLAELPARLPTEKFHAWMRGADKILLHALEHARQRR